MLNDKQIIKIIQSFEIFTLFQAQTGNKYFNTDNSTRVSQKVLRPDTEIAHV